MERTVLVQRALSNAELGGLIRQHRFVVVCVYIVWDPAPPRYGPKRFLERLAARYREFRFLRIKSNDLPGAVDVLPQGPEPEYFIYVNANIVPSLPRLTESNLERNLIRVYAAQMR